MRRFSIVSLCVAVGLLAAGHAAAGKLYKWVDEHGNVHYGDAIPPEHAKVGHEEMNARGITVNTVAREKTEAELAEQARLEREAEQLRMQQMLQAERDRILLDTYLSIDEIEMLRDQRIRAVEAHIGVTRHYLKNLQAKWDEMNLEAQQFNFPYTEDSKLPPLPEDLAQHIIFTEQAMADYMQSIAALRQEQGQIRNEFERDMERFLQLKAKSQ